jgi:hypothetical protein
MGKRSSSSIGDSCKVDSKMRTIYPLVMRYIISFSLRIGTTHYRWKSVPPPPPSRHDAMGVVDVRITCLTQTPRFRVIHVRARLRVHPPSIISFPMHIIFPRGRHPQYRQILVPRPSAQPRNDHDAVPLVHESRYFLWIIVVHDDHVRHAVRVR